MVAGIIKTTVFTRVFNPEAFGRYGIISITFLIFSLIFLTWNSNIIWRYYHYFSKRGGKHFFMSNLFFLFLFQNVAFLIISLGYSFFSDKASQLLIGLFTIQIIVSHLLNTILTILRVFSLTKVYNIIQILRTLLSLGLMFYLVFYQNHSIEVFVESIIMIEVPLVVVLLILYKNTLLFRLTRLSWVIQKMIFRYIPPSLISNLGLILLANSDRYIINLFQGLDATGIYNQAYNLAMMGLNSLILVFQKIVTPKLVHVLEVGDNRSEGVLRNNLLIYSVIILPIVVYFSIYSKIIVEIFMGKPFHESYTIIPWINIGIFLSGYVYFFELKMKFEGQNRKVVLYYLGAIVLNVLLNFAFIPLWGFQAASITTFISYFAMFIMFIWGRSFIFFKKSVLKSLLLNRTIIVLFIQVCIYLFIRSLKFDVGFLFSFCEGSLFFITLWWYLLKKQATRSVLRKAEFLLVASQK